MKERNKLHFREIDKFEKEYVGENEHDKEVMQKENQLLIFSDSLYTITGIKR